MRRVAAVAKNVQTFNLCNLLHCAIQRAELGLGDVAPPRVIEVEVERRRDSKDLVPNLVPTSAS